MYTQNTYLHVHTYADCIVGPSICLQALMCHMQFLKNILRQQLFTICENSLFISLRPEGKAMKNVHTYVWYVHIHLFRALSCIL